MKPPAFQEYAANILANRAFKVLSATERGVLHSMRLEFWVNGPLPAVAETLGPVLGMSDQDMRQGFTPRVKMFFAVVDGFLVDVELAEYRRALESRKQAQINAANATNERKRAKRDKPQSRAAKGGDGKRDANRDANRDGSATVPRLEQTSFVKDKPSSERSNSQNTFVQEMEQAERAEQEQQHLQRKPPT